MRTRADLCFEKLSKTTCDKKQLLRKDKALANMGRFIYVGMAIHKDGNCYIDINIRFGKAKETLKSHQNVEIKGYGYKHQKYEFLNRNVICFSNTLKHE